MTHSPVRSFLRALIPTTSSEAAEGEETDQRNNHSEDDAPEDRDQDARDHDSPAERKPYATAGRGSIRHDYLRSSEIAGRAAESFPENRELKRLVPAFSDVEGAVARIGLVALTQLADGAGFLA
jgi:hypothetical protein